MKHKIKNILKRIPFSIVYFVINIPFLNFKIIKGMREYFAQNEMLSYWKKYPNKKSNKQKVIVYGLRTNAMCNMATFEKVLSDSFRFQGANVLNLICNNVLSSCEGESKDISNKVICGACRNQRAYHFKYYPDDYIKFSDFINEKEITSIKAIINNLSVDQLEYFKFLGVNVGRHAVDSVIYKFQYFYVKENKDHLETLRDSIYRGMICVQVAQNLVKKENPTHLLTLHGCYATWGPFCEYFANHNIEVYVYRKLFAPSIGYVDFPRWTEKISMKDIPAKKNWDIKKNVELANKQNEDIKAFFSRRMVGSSQDYKLFYDQKKGNLDNTIFEWLNQPEMKKYVLYLHSLWDIDFESITSNCFDGLMDWICETIQYFKNKTGYCLILKPHPAENSYFEQQKKGASDLIMERLKTLPDNVCFVGNDAPITSYDLMAKGCVCITYYGTVCLEYSFYKKPAIVAADVHYVEAGAVYKIRSKKEYFNLIDNPEPLQRFAEENHKTIERYAYHNFFRRNVRIPFFSDKVILGRCIVWDVLKNYSGFIENDKTLNQITASILDGKYVVNPD